MNEWRKKIRLMMKRTFILLVEKINEIIRKINRKEKYCDAIVTHNFRHAVNCMCYCFTSGSFLFVYSFRSLSLFLSLSISLFFHQHFQTRNNILAFIYVTICAHVSRTLPFKLKLKQMNWRTRECTGMGAIMLQVHPM